MRAAAVRAARPSVRLVPFAVPYRSCACPPASVLSYKYGCKLVVHCPHWPQVDAQLLGPGEHSYDHFLRHCSLDKVALEPGPWQRVRELREAGGGGLPSGVGQRWCGITVMWCSGLGMSSGRGVGSG